MTETSYEKGENFEKLFAEFMKSDLGWDNYRIRSQQQSKGNYKGSQVDVIGIRQDPMGRKLQGLALFYCGLMLIAMVIGFVIEDAGLAIFGLVFGAGGVIAAVISRERHKEHAWVECKNRKTKSTYDDIRKSLEELNNYKASGNKEFKYKIHYFVSANGFVDNALKCANDNRIICYVYKDGKFEIEKYWK